MPSSCSHVCRRPMDLTEISSEQGWGHSAGVFFETSEGSSTLDHIKPMSNEFGIRGRRPTYKFGRNGPHSNEALPEIGEGSFTVAEKTLAKAQSASKADRNMSADMQSCAFGPGYCQSRKTWQLIAHSCCAVGPGLSRSQNGVASSKTGGA